MTTTLRFAVVLFALTFLARTSEAQLTKIFVASYGNDANDGSRGAPKRNFQPAHNAVAAGGQIVVLDTAGYGALTINKSLAVTVPPGVNGFVTVSGSSNGILISASSSDIVVLRGLIVEGGGPAANGTGIVAVSVGRLTVDDCVVRNFTVGTYLLNAPGSHLLVRGGSVRNTQFGIEVHAASSGVILDGLVTNCAVDNASQAALFVRNEAVSSVAATLTAVGCTLTNSGNGLVANGSTSVLYADNCVVSGNTTDVATVNGANTFSRGNNVCTNNAGTGSFTGALSGK